MNTPHARRMWAWIAVWAILLGALAPTVSRALAGQGGTPAWVEVCTANGPRWIAATPGDVSAGVDQPSPAGPDAATLDHCPLCVLMHGSAMPPPALVSVPMPPADRLQLPNATREGMRQPVRGPAWPRGPPRAPESIDFSA